MHLFYTPSVSSANESFTLSEEESKHCIRVLRLVIGDKIVLIDGKGGWYNAVITDENPKRCVVKIVEVQQKTGHRTFCLHIAIAPTKNNDRMEWFIEKATEIGIDEVSLIECKNSERNVIKTERLEKVAVAAIKQSLKAYLPKINELVAFKKFIDSVTKFNGQKFIAHCNEAISKVHLKTLYTKGEEALILIGPEGDFTPEEVKLALSNGFKEISLGSSRLRTETAALYCCTVINVLNEE
jgi:16S rRNA (uracil1498-N3)-methyltransferase